MVPIQRAVATDRIWIRNLYCPPVVESQPSHPIAPPAVPSTRPASPPLGQPTPSAPQPSNAPQADPPDEMTAAEPVAPQSTSPLNQSADANFDNVSASDFQSDFASSRASFTSAPTVIGDFAGGGLAQVRTTIPFLFDGYAVVTGAVPTFDLIPTGGINPDLIAFGAGSDGSGDGNIDTFDLSEPLPPTDASLPTGPGISYVNGQAFYTNNQTDTTAQDGIFADGDTWYFVYQFEQNLGPTDDGRAFVPVPSPGVSVRRVKISENFSPEVRSRVFFNYSFFNDAYGGLGDVSRYIFGAEHILVDELFSIEGRVPLAGTYASRQNLDQREDRDPELGNISLIGKLILLRDRNCLWSAGLGVGLPTADDTEITAQGVDYIQIRNRTVLVQPFTAALVRRGKTTLQSFLQLDIPAGADPVLVNSNLSDPVTGNLVEIGEFQDSTFLHWDVSLHRIFYENEQTCGLRTAIANAELHYSASLEESDLVQTGNFTYTNLQPDFRIVNATFGSHLIFGKQSDIVVTPAISIPLRDGFDAQFDYEALVQVNFLR
ncbi:MAG: hypothetical protein AAGD07_02605 [Planctomycetota bacterium]